MKIWDTLRRNLPPSTDWYSLLFMAATAPIVAACVHSLCVFSRGFRLYNAEIGGSCFYGMGMSHSFGLADFIIFFSGCAGGMIPTFVLLLPGRTRVFYRWTVWLLCIVLWMWLMFHNEVAMK